MSKADRLLLEIAHDVCCAMGVEVSLDTAHKHPRLVLAIHGRTRFVVAPKTPSDHRSLANMRSNIRREAQRLLGLA